ncbi:nucleotidyl transferase [Verrucomicrobia bacterium LW23]|nr:nucleotidyl transferase [Verrucomicrobia bacterium LW23]
MQTVAILAGGLATRLRPITEKIPKALVDVAGRPFLAHQIELLRAQGVTRLVLCVGYLGGMIRDQFGDGSAHGVELLYSEDGPTLLGTGGALRKALPLLGDAFFVLYGDSYLPIDYQAVAAAYTAAAQPGLMTVYHNQGRWDTSNVWFEGGTLRVYDKKNRTPQMRHIDYGLSILHRDTLARRPADIPFDLAEVLTDLSHQGRLAGYEVHQRFYEVGSHSGLAELNALLGGAPAS